MALTGNYEAPEGFTLPKAYFRANATGSLSRPLITVDVWASQEVAEAAGRGDEGAEAYRPITQLPMGYHVVNTALPTGPQVYAVVKAAMPDLEDAV